MTIKELYKYAVDNQLEDLPIEVVGIAEYGHSAVFDTTFFVRKAKYKSVGDMVQLIVTEENVPCKYGDAVSSDDI